MASSRLLSTVASSVGFGKIDAPDDGHITTRYPQSAKQGDLGMEDHLPGQVNSAVRQIETRNVPQRIRSLHSTTLDSSCLDYERRDSCLIFFAFFKYRLLGTYFDSNCDTDRLEDACTSTSSASWRTCTNT